MKQWAVPGRVAGGDATVSWVDSLLKRYGFVPEDATPVQYFALPMQDVWIVRYRHPAFPIVADFMPVDTTAVDPEELGEGRQP